MQGRPRFLPCTPHGILQILSRNQIPTAGAKVVVVGAATSSASRWPCCLMQKGKTSKKGDGTFCAEHSKGRPGKRCLSPFRVGRRHRDRLPQPHPRSGGRHANRATF